MLKLNIEAQHSFKSLVSKMGSEYFLSLSNEDKLRYNDKLTLSNGVKLEDPYLLTTGWLDDLRKLPKISWKNVISYLVDTPSQYTKESLKAFKSLDGIEYFREGHVQECFYHETCSKSFCFLKSKVLPSQRQSKSAVMYNVWVAINVQHGWILTGNCTCIAGLGSVCSHVGALLFKLEAVVHYKLNEAVACTGQICSWKATKKYVEPAPIDQICFKRAKKHALPKTKFKASTKGNYCHPDPSFGKSLISNEQFRELYSMNSSAVILDSIDKSDFYSASSMVHDSDAESGEENDENVLPEPLTSLFDPTTINMSRDELSSFASKKYSSYVGGHSQKAYENLCHVTMTQSRSTNWMQHRAGRITASICFNVARTRIEKPSKSLVHKIMQYDGGAGSNNKYTRYGRTHEAVAKAAYHKIFCSQHKDAQVVETGFHVKANMPFLGASPDGLVTCHCHPDRILEIKCPFTYKNGFSSWKADKNFPITAERHMKTHHAYYYQMQLQMFVCNVKSGDYFMFASEKPDDYFLLTIEYDKQFMGTLLKDLWTKFQAFILPEIITRKDDDTENDRKLYCKCQRPAFGNMIACDKSSCKNQWYHYPCVNITRAPKNSWFCEHCKK